MTKIEIGRLETPIGAMEVGVHAGALCALRFDDRWGTGVDVVQRRFPDAEVVPSENPAGAVTVLRAYFEGDVHGLGELAVDMGGTPFQDAVWTVLRDVPAGETVTYGDLARRVGAPAAVRAVGTTMARNPVGIVVPCHRVVPAGGGVGNYGGGVDRKTWLLAHEAAHA